MNNHNSFMHNDETKSQIGLESVWVTTWWPIQVFALFLAYAEVNVYLEMKSFLKTDEIFMKFRGKLGKALIHNSYINGESCNIPSNKRKRKISHTLETAPTHATEYDGGKWVCPAKIRFQQYICRWPKC